MRSCLLLLPCILNGSLMDEPDPRRPIDAAVAAASPPPRHRHPGRDRVHSRRQGRDLSEVGGGQPQPGPLEVGSRAVDPAASSPGRRAGRHRRERLPRGGPPPERQRLRETGHHPGRPGRGRRLAHPPSRATCTCSATDGPSAASPRRPAPRSTPSPRATARRSRSSATTSCIVLDLGQRQETRLTRAAADGLTHGLAEFIAQEEMDRVAGFWWSPDGAPIAYQETDERHIPALLDRPPGGRGVLGRDPPLSVRRRGQRQGPARRRPGRRRRDPLAGACRRDRRLLPGPGQLGWSDAACSSRLSQPRPEVARLYRIDVARIARPC